MTAPDDGGLLLDQLRTVSTDLVTLAQRTIDEVEAGEVETAQATLGVMFGLVDDVRAAGGIVVEEPAP